MPIRSGVAFDGFVQKLIYLIDITLAHRAHEIVHQLVVAGLSGAVRGWNIPVGCPECAWEHGIEGAFEEHLMGGVLDESGLHRSSNVRATIDIDGSHGSNRVQGLACRDRKPARPQSVHKVKD